MSGSLFDSRSSRLLGRLVVFAVSTLASVLLVEMVFRVFEIRPMEVQRREFDPIMPFTRTGGQPSRVMRPNVETNQVYYTCREGECSEDRRIPFRTNAMGWRDEDVALRKAPNTVRIVVLGDSFTAGDGVPEERIYAEVLEDLLNERYGGRYLFEVLNTGIQSTSTYDQWYLLQSQAMQFDPDMILVGMYPNDTMTQSAVHIVSPAASNVRVDLAYPQKWYLDKWIESFAYNRMSYSATLDMYEGLWDAGRNPQGVSQWIQAMNSLGRNQQERRIPTLILLFPWLNMLDETYPFGGIHEQIASKAQEVGIEVLDLLPVYSSLDPMPPIWCHESDHHPSVELHRTAAESVYEKLLDDPGSWHLPEPGDG